jgi:hypothetical protein
VDGRVPNRQKALGGMIILAVGESECGSVVEKDALFVGAGCHNFDCDEGAARLMRRVLVGK